MRRNATSQASDSLNPSDRVPYTLSPLAFEDFYDIAAYTLTPAGRAEIDLEQKVTLTPGLQSLLDKFTAARLARERARGKEQLLPALTREEEAAIQLAWALECAVNKGL